MHNDITAILHCYLEEAISKSRKNDVPKNTQSGNVRIGKRGSNVVLEEKKGEQDASGAASAKSAPSALTDVTHNSKRIKTVLAEASEEDLVKVLA